MKNSRSDAADWLYNMASPEIKGYVEKLLYTKKKERKKKMPVVVNDEGNLYHQECFVKENPTVKLDDSMFVEAEREDECDYCAGPLADSPFEDEVDEDDFEEEEEEE